MKLIRHILVTIVFLAIATKSLSQSGVYYGKTNYEKGKTSYQIPCTSGFSSKQLYEFYNNKYINLSKAEYHKKFKKKDIWGYRDCRGFNYKIVNKIHYKILENDALVLYVVSYSINTNFRDFQKNTLPKYYFSKDIASPIYPLTETNLSKVYQFNDEYLQKVKNYLQSPYSCIYCYDGHDETYVINELLRECSNEIMSPINSLSN